MTNVTNREKTKGNKRPNTKIEYYFVLWSCLFDQDVLCDIVKRPQRVADDLQQPHIETAGSQSGHVQTRLTLWPS